MKVGIIIPDRGDRPHFLDHCLTLLSKQTVTPDCVVFMTYKPESSEKDITQRYRRGYDRLRDTDVDVIFLLESDDFYSPIYIETMLREWNAVGQPELFGLTSTIYYHIGIRKYFTMHHTERSSAMCTMVKPDLNFNWCPDNEPYTDTHIWMSARHADTGKELTRAQYTPPTPICLGIKNFHPGLTGGNMHNDRLDRYDRFGSADPDCRYLDSVVDPVSLEFYRDFYRPDFNPH